MLIFPGCNQNGYQTFTAKRIIFASSSWNIHVLTAYKDGPDLYEKSYFHYFCMPDKDYQMINPDPNAKDTKTVTVYHNHLYK